MVTKFKTKQEIIDYVCVCSGCEKIKFKKLKPYSKNERILHNGEAVSYIIKNKLGIDIKVYIQSEGNFYKAWVETIYGTVKLL